MIQWSDEVPQYTPIHLIPFFFFFFFLLLFGILFLESTEEEKGRSMFGDDK